MTADDDRLEHLAQRERELVDLTRRGKRKTVAIVVLCMGPVAIVLALLAHRPDGAPSGALAVPIIGMVVGMAIAVTIIIRQTRRDPGANLAMGFTALRRSQRWAVYRAMWAGRAIEDPTLLSMTRSLHDQGRRQMPRIVVSFVILTCLGPGMMLLTHDHTFPTWASLALLIALPLVLAQQIWIVRRSGIVIAHSDEKPLD